MLQHDGAVDELFVGVRSELIGFIVNVAQQHAEEGRSADLLGTSDEAETAIDLMMIAKYLERIGDHATNVAEWVAFSITGVHSGGFDTKPE